jgi:hypothetical protein
MNFVTAYLVLALKGEKQQVKELIRMTQIGRMFEEEKEEAVKNAVNQAVNQAVKDTTETISKNTVIKMLKDGFDAQIIIKYVQNYSLEDVLRVKQEINL